MYQASDLGQIPMRVAGLRARDYQRDARVSEVQAVRRGDFQSIAPDLFSDDFQRPIVANLIDTAARDFAAMVAPLPAFNCSASSMLNESAKKFADKRTKIARDYIQCSNLELQMMASGADMYNSFGMIVFCVEPDFEDKAPRIFVESSIGAYAVKNHKGRTVEFVRVSYIDWFALVADYPQLRGMQSKYPFALPNGKVEIVKYCSDERVTKYLPKMGDYVLEDMPNPLGKCYYEVGFRPNFEESPRGAYDDVVWVQLARHRIQMLLMEGVDKAVRAPLVVPMDVDDLALGADGIIHTNGGAASVGRARLDMPPQAFSAVEQLKQEQQLGSMSSEGRSGQTDASVITGRGLQELAAGFDSQIAVAQTILKASYKRTIQLCFEMDEKIFGNAKKDIQGNDSGVPYSITYQPSKDIDGDHTIDITYGFAAGLDPNRALVFLLQADGAGLVSKDYIRRNLPVDLNAAEEEKKIVIEQSRAGLVQAMSALAQSIPQLAASGGDPVQIISQQATFIQLLGKGKDIEDAAVAAFAPPKPPKGAPSATDASGLPGSQDDGSGGAGGPQGFDSSTGLPGQLSPNLATQGPNARPDLQSMFAGLGASGNPDLKAGVSRQQPVAGQ
jgi:hypothetical protein